MASSDFVRIFEVGPRDGLQNEKRKVTYAQKVKLIEGLAAAGLPEIEMGAFVRADKVPQMADTEKLYAALSKGKLALGTSRPWALVPNRKGLERALALGARNLAVFTASTETFNRRNIGMSVDESLAEIREVIAQAKAAGITQIRGYVSTAFGCPYEGKVAPQKPLRVMDALLKAGVKELSIGDTIGVATPGDVDALLQPAIQAHGTALLAVHFHDTRGTALANTLRAIELGIRTVDSSAGGLGGCPFAPGATGNLATEDLVYMLQGMGLSTGVDLEKLVATSLAFAKSVRRPLASRYLTACEASASRLLTRKKAVDPLPS